MGPILYGIKLNAGKSGHFEGTLEADARCERRLSAYKKQLPATVGVELYLDCCTSMEWTVEVVGVNESYG